jgi:hypothetical protein
MSQTSPLSLARSHYIARRAENETAGLVFGSGSGANTFHIAARHPGFEIDVLVTAELAAFYQVCWGG